MIQNKKKDNFLDNEKTRELIFKRNIYIKNACLII